MKYIFYSLILLLSTSGHLFSQIKLDISEVDINKPDLGEEFFFKHKDGRKLENGKYKIIGLRGEAYISFELKDGILISIFQIFSPTKRLAIEALADNKNIVTELRRYQIWADESKNIGPPVLIEKKELKKGVYCKTVFGDKDKITYKKCTKDDDEVYLFQCSEYTDKPEIQYCKERDYLKKESKEFKNHKLFRETKFYTAENYSVIKNYDDSEVLLNTVYEYSDSTKTVKPNGSYSLEIFTNQKSTVKTSTYSEFDKLGKQTLSEKREKQRFFDGTTELKRIQKDKVIIETYNNSMELIETREEEPYHNRN